MNIDSVSPAAELVYIHLGKDFSHQQHIFESLRQAKLMNASAGRTKITLILCDAALESLSPALKREVALDYSLISYDRLFKRSKILKEFKQIFFNTTKRRPNGNTNFTRYAVERLLVLYEYILTVESAMKIPASLHLYQDLILNYNKKRSFQLMMISTTTNHNSNHQHHHHHRYFPSEDLIGCKHGGFFHMESDNMLYADLSVEVLPRFLDCNINGAFQIVSKNYAIHNFDYWRNTAAIAPLALFIMNAYRAGPKQAAIKYTEGGMSDMTLGYTFAMNTLRSQMEERERKLENASDIAGMAIEYGGKLSFSVMPSTLEFDDRFDPGSRCIALGRSIDNENDIRQEKEPDEWFIFDGATLGQYFGGRFGFPNKRYWNADRHLDPRGKTIEWKKNENGLYLPFYEGKRVINIHLHAKNLQDFSSIEPRRTVMD